MSTGQSSLSCSLLVTWLYLGFVLSFHIFCSFLEVYNGHVPHMTAWIWHQRPAGKLTHNSQERKREWGGGNTYFDKNRHSLSFWGHFFRFSDFSRIISQSLNCFGYVCCVECSSESTRRWVGRRCKRSTFSRAFPVWRNPVDSRRSSAHVRTLRFRVPLLVYPATSSRVVYAHGHCYYSHFVEVTVCGNSYCSHVLLCCIAAPPARHCLHGLDPRAHFSVPWPHSH